MEKEEDMAVTLSKLVEDVENLNVQRFKCVLEIKVDILNQRAFSANSDYKIIFGVVSAESTHSSYCL